MKHLKSFYEKLTNEERLIRKKFKEEIWKNFSKKDQDRLINLRYDLSTLRDEMRWLKSKHQSTSDVVEKIKNRKKEIAKIENEYFDKYSHLLNIVTNKTLNDINDKTGVFENKVLKKETSKKNIL